MPFHVTEEQDLIRRTVAEFAQKTVAPAARDVDRSRRAPKEALEGMAGLGLLGLFVPPDQGGAGADTVTYCLVLEELARACASTAVIMGTTNAMVTLPIVMHGTEAQKETWLRSMAAGRAVGGFALAEPNAGSDIANLATRATPDGDGFVIEGGKTFVSAGALADVFLVVARTKDGPSLFLVPSDDERVLVGEPEALLGLHGTMTAPVFFRKVRVPGDALVGAGGAALDLVREPMDVARLGVASVGTGLLQASLDACVEFADTREQFGKKIREFQAIQEKLARIDRGVRVSRLLALAGADARDRGQAFGVLASEAKWFATEEGRELTRQSIKLHGGSGFMRDLPAERYYRDIRTLGVLGGTNEMMRHRVVKDLYA